MVVMVRALAAITVLAAGLPIAGWLLSRGMAAKQTTQSPGGLGPPTDAADKWLIERHKLPLCSAGECGKPLWRAALS